jgi:hypothetical protein
MRDRCQTCARSGSATTTVDHGNDSGKVIARGFPFRDDLSRNFQVNTFSQIARSQRKAAIQPLRANARWRWRTHERAVC